jgi:hypothetical protein
VKEPGPPRWLLFCLAAAALLTSALTFSAAGEEHRHESESAERPPSRRATFTAAPRESAAPNPLAGRLLRLHRGRIAASARRFLAAFARYEFGELGPSVRAELRSTATPRFASLLLASPPRLLAAGPPPTGELLWLDVVPLGGAAPRALVLGALRRGRASEPFSFGFLRRGGRWLADAVAE